MHQQKLYHQHHHHDGGEVSFEKNLAILEYMVDHNRHHAEDLDELADALEKQDHADIAKQLKACLVDYNAANDKLADIYKQLKEK